MWWSNELTIKKYIEQCLALSERSIKLAIVINYNKAPDTGKDFETQSSIQIMWTLWMKLWITMNKVDGERMTRINEKAHSLQTLTGNCLHQGIWRLLKTPECMVIWERILDVTDLVGSRGDLNFRKMNEMNSALFYQPACKQGSYSPSQLFLEIFSFLSMFAHNGQLAEVILGFEMKPWHK